jgi:hypothetical protein
MIETILNHNGVFKFGQPDQAEQDAYQAQRRAEAKAIRNDLLPSVSDYRKLHAQRDAELMRNCRTVIYK